MMEVTWWQLRVLLMLLTAVVVVADGKYDFNCKFSNEGCESDAECCSAKCLQAHPGTNPRCTRSSLHRSCLYSYQCEDRLSCGPNNTCCSKYWGTCRQHGDCCHSQFVCLEAEGFYYKRCLMGPARSSCTRPWGTGSSGALRTAAVLFFAQMVVRFCVITDLHR